MSSHLSWPSKGCGRIVMALFAGIAGLLALLNGPAIATAAPANSAAPQGAPLWRWDGDTVVINVEEYLSAQCWSSRATVRLEIKRSGRWQRVESNRPARASGCPSRAPFATTWNWTGDAGRTYRVREIQTRGSTYSYSVAWRGSSSSGGGDSSCSSFYNGLALQALADGDTFSYLRYRDLAASC